MENLIRNNFKVSDLKWFIAFLISIGFNYANFNNRIETLEIRLEKQEQQIQHLQKGLSIFYKFYQQNECTLLAKERIDNPNGYEDLTYQALCITGNFNNENEK